MKINDRKFKIFLITLLSLSIIAILTSFIGVHAEFEKYLRVIIFVTSVIFTIYFIAKARIDQALTFIIVCVLFNPFFAINLDKQVFRVIEIPVISLFIHRLYLLVIENDLLSIEQDADNLDRYFKELEHIITPLTYHQISIYIKKRYPQECKINDESVKWKIKELPDAEFEISREFYSLGKNSKGGVTAKMINKYQNIEIHLNFNLTDIVKLTIKEGKEPHKANRLARYLKTALVSKYHYLEL